MNLPKRLPLAHLPTPIQRLEGLSKELGCELLVKRDDLTGSHLSGNKIRKLEYLLAEAKEVRATHIVTCGGVQSNHCRASALAARSLGMTPEILLRTQDAKEQDLPSPSIGNVLLDRVARANIHLCTPDEYRSERNERMKAIADKLRGEGARPYIIPEGGSNALGALGYVKAAKEIVDAIGSEQATQVWLAVGSGGTLAGLALGFKALGVPYRALGVPVCDDAATFEAIVQNIARKAHERFNLPQLKPADYALLEGFQGRGYALTSEPELKLILNTLEQDGLVLDHVYSGKAFSAFRANAATAPAHERQVFLHTGGIFGLGAAAEHIDHLRKVEGAPHT